MKKTAIIFPGQGSQKIGMLQDIAADYDVIKQTFAEASDVLGYDVWQLSQQGPEEKLNQTEFTQPAILTASIALWRVLQQNDAPPPSFLAGHSLGEYSALVCANAMQFSDAVKLVQQRGQFMQQATAEGVGAMAAVIGMAKNEVSKLCEQAAQGQVLSLANDNSIGQVVIAGNSEAVDRFIIAAKDAGAKLVKRLPVSVPSHCQLMQPAAEQLANALATIEIKTPQIPVIHNVDVRAHGVADHIREKLVQQLCSPVRWVETIQMLVNEGVDCMLECGPGKVLAGLNKRIDKQITTLTVQQMLAMEEQQ